MNQLVRSVARTEALHICGELLHGGQQVFLAHKFRRTGRNMKNAQAFPTLHNPCGQWPIAPRKAAHPRPEPNKRARDWAHISIPAATAHTARRCQGRGMIADKGNSSEHDARPLRETTGAL